MIPGFKNLTGYAFLATDATALNAALRRAMETVKAARYSFTVASVSAARVTSGNFLYEASFIPFVGDDPFWRGHLKKYQIDDTGKVVKPAEHGCGGCIARKGRRQEHVYLPRGYHQGL